MRTTRRLPRASRGQSGSAIGVYDSAAQNPRDDSGTQYLSERASGTKVFSFIEDLVFVLLGARNTTVGLIGPQSRIRKMGRRWIAGKSDSLEN